MRISDKGKSSFLYLSVPFSQHPVLISWMKYALYLYKVINDSFFVCFILKCCVVVFFKFLHSLCFFQIAFILFAAVGC